MTTKLICTKCKTVMIKTGCHTPKCTKCESRQHLLTDNEGKPVKVNVNRTRIVL